MSLDSTYFGNGTTLLLAIGLIIFILIWFAFKLEEEHTFLKIFCLIFAIFTLILIPKVAIDYSGDCVVMVANATTTGSTISYDYVSECSQNTNTTQYTLLKTVTYFIWFFSIYLIVFYTYKINKIVWERMKKIKL